MFKDGRKRKVMVVDDDLGIREAFEAILGEEYNLLIADSGYRALELFNLETPSLIFLDILMPGLDGLQVIERLKFMDGKLKVVLITATEEESYIRRGIELGAVCCLKKPFDCKEVKEVAKTLLAA